MADLNKLQQEKAVHQRLYDEALKNNDYNTAAVQKSWLDSYDEKISNQRKNNTTYNNSLSGQRAEYVDELNNIVNYINSARAGGAPAEEVETLENALADIEGKIATLDSDLADKKATKEDIKNKITDFKKVITNPKLYKMLGTASAVTGLNRAVDVLVPAETQTAIQSAMHPIQTAKAIEGDVKAGKQIVSDIKEGKPISEIAQDKVEGIKEGLGKAKDNIKYAYDDLAGKTPEEVTEEEVITPTETIESATIAPSEVNKNVATTTPEVTAQATKEEVKPSYNWRDSVENLTKYGNALYDSITAMHKRKANQAAALSGFAGQYGSTTPIFSEEETKAPLENIRQQAYNNYISQMKAQQQAMNDVTQTDIRNKYKSVYDIDSKNSVDRQAYATQTIGQIQNKLNVDLHKDIMSMKKEELQKFLEDLQKDFSIISSSIEDKGIVEGLAASLPKFIEMLQKGSLEQALLQANVNVVGNAAEAVGNTATTLGGLLGKLALAGL